MKPNVTLIFDTIGRARHGASYLRNVLGMPSRCVSVRRYAVSFNMPTLDEAKAIRNEVDRDAQLVFKPL